MSHFPLALVVHLKGKRATDRGLVTALDTLFTLLLNKASNAWPEPMQGFRRHSILRIAPSMKSGVWVKTE